MNTDKEQLQAFISRLAKYPRVIIQAHDFPDHDAVSSAFALSRLLNMHHIETVMVYNGVIDRVSLQNLIDFLEIDLSHWKDADLNEDDIVITVDGCMGEKNMFDIPGREIAVIDHHQVIAPDSLWYSDIRPEYGATATIVYEYFLTLGLDIPADCCTALQVGLAIDTANLTRGFIEQDVQAFAYFHRFADQEMVNKICRNSLLQDELEYYKQMLEVMETKGKVATAWLQEGCPKNMLGILGDFLLTLDEVEIVILAATADDVIQLSLRSECKKNDVSEIVKSTLNDNEIGFGGGHSHMAGGIILRDKLSDAIESETASTLFDLFLKQVRH